MALLIFIGGTMFGAAATIGVLMFTAGGRGPVPEDEGGARELASDKA